MDCFGRFIDLAASARAIQHQLAKLPEGDLGIFGGCSSLKGGSVGVQDATTPRRCLAPIFLNADHTYTRGRPVARRARRDAHAFASGASRLVWTQHAGESVCIASSEAPR